METGFILAALVWWEIVILIILCIGLFLSLVNESAIATAIVFVVLFVMPWSGTGYLLGGKFSFMEFLGFVVASLGLGVVWSLFKWRDLAVKTKQALLAKEKRYPDSYTYSDDQVKEQLSHEKNSDVIGFWIVFWPFSVTAYVLRFFLSDMINIIIRRLSGVYDRITEGVLK